MLEGLEGSMGHNSILRVRYEKGWVTMRGVDGNKILGPVRDPWHCRLSPSPPACVLIFGVRWQPNAMADAKMEEAIKKLQQGEYKKAAMVFSKVCAVLCCPARVEANFGSAMGGLETSDIGH